MCTFCKKQMKLVLETKFPRKINYKTTIYIAKALKNFKKYNVKCCEERNTLTTQ